MNLIPTSPIDIRKLKEKRDPYTQASPVVVTRADGSQEIQPAMTRTQFRKTVNKGKGLYPKNKRRR